VTVPDVFEYALVRVVPRVERGEAINVGVIVYSQAFRYLCARIELNEPRLLAVDPAADLDAVRAGLSAFEKACTEGPLAHRAQVHHRPARPGAQRPHRRPGRRTHPPLRHPGPRYP
jgi:hypothetical protein